MNLINNQNYSATHYEPSTGTFWRLSKAFNDYIPIQLHDRRVNVIQTSTGRYTWKGAGNLAWEYITGSPLPKGFLIYFKNLDNEDFRAENLGIIHRSELRSLKAAMLNVKGSLRIIPNTKEVYTYKVRWKEPGVFKQKCFQDWIAANDFYNFIMQKCVKELGKYAVTQ